jgi:putative (di)nucleoside polyphosphate hydrolase
LLTYDFPIEIAGLRWDGKYRGQEQKWFLMRLEAPDSTINLTYKDVEFSAWRWMGADGLLAAIVAFKRPIYRAVLAEFGLI